jgi:glutamyl-tRNA synthetase
MSQIIDLFTLEGVNPANPIFDMEKLEWMNGEYIRAYDNEKLLDLVLPFLIKENLITEEMASQKKEWLLRFIFLLKERCKTLKEFAEKGKYFFTFDYQYEPTAVSKHFNSPESADRLSAFVDRLLTLDEFGKEKIEEALRKLADEMQVKPASLIHVVRLATTGTTAGPGLFDILEFLGKDEVEKRTIKAVKFIKQKHET